MSDDKNLYFIPIISKAFENRDLVNSMKIAFDQIKNLGKRPEYNKGCNQFLEFCNFIITPQKESCEADIKLLANGIYNIIYDLVTDNYSGSESEIQELISTIQGHSKWKDEFDRIQKMHQDLTVPAAKICIELLCEDELIGTLPISGSAFTFSNLKPGNYQIRLTTGRVLWEGNFTREDLIWAYAYPEKDLLMAAETDPESQKATKIESFLNGELEMLVFAGLESGEIKIHVKNI